MVQREHMVLPEAKSWSCSLVHWTKESRNHAGDTASDGLSSPPQVERKREIHWLIPSFFPPGPFQCLPVAKLSQKSLVRGVGEISSAGVGNLDSKQSRGRQGAGLEGSRYTTGTRRNSYFRSASDLELRIPNRRMG